MRSKEKPNAHKEKAGKEKAETPYTKSVPMTDEELEQVSGGIAIFEGSKPAPALMEKI